jgi:hypothetical protein
MKKIFVILSSAVLIILAGCSLLPLQNAVQPAPANTAAPDFTGKLFPAGADLYAGPGENFPKAGQVTDTVQIVGQAYGCSWFFVISPAQSITGWLKAEQITYTVPCADVPGIQIPTVQPTDTLMPSATFTLEPSATFTLMPSPTFTKIPPSNAGAPLPPKNKCNVDSAMTIGNRTGAYANFTLVGPGTFYVSLPPDENTSVPVCEGCYDVYITGACGDSGGGKAFSLCDGFNGWIYCNK